MFSEKVDLIYETDRQIGGLLLSEDIQLILFTDRDGHLSDDLYIYDRGHLNENGYAIWTPVIREKLEKL